MQDSNIEIYFDDLDKSIDLKIILNKEDALKIIKKQHVTIDSLNSKRYKINIHRIANGKILAEVGKINKYAYLVNSLEDFHLIRTRTLVYKLAKDKEAFYSTIYRGKGNVEAIIKKYSGKELQEYSNKFVKLFLLNNDKYFHTEHIYIDGVINETRGVLYNSKKDCESLYLFENIKTKE